MLQRYQGIVLCSFKYNDTKNIAHIFTRENGRMSVAIEEKRCDESFVSAFCNG